MLTKTGICISRWLFADLNLNLQVHHWNAAVSELKGTCTLNVLSVGKNIEDLDQTARVAVSSGSSMFAFLLCLI